MCIRDRANREINLEIGRVVLFTFGPYVNRLAVVLDMVSAKQVLVSGPGLGVPKVVTNVKRLKLTKFRLAAVKKGEKESTLTQKISDSDVQGKFDSSVLGTKLRNQEKRRNLSDFERFKAKQLRMRINKLIRAHVNKNRKRLAAN